MSFTRNNLFTFFTLFFFFFFVNVDHSLQSNTFSISNINPLSPQASLRRHWSRLFPSITIPGFLLSKSSPLNASQVAVFSNYLHSGNLHSHFPSFCSAANLFCDFSNSPLFNHHHLHANTEFKNYKNMEFKKYQKECLLSGQSFKNYSSGENVGHDFFSNYGQENTGSREEFTGYAGKTNVGGSGFTNYATDSNGEASDFKLYGGQSNLQGHQFKNYGSDSSAGVQSFTSYSEDSNVVKHGFKAYGSKANAILNQFSSYSTQSNMAKNEFKLYNEAGNGAIDLFKGYAGATNVGKNEFQAYDVVANGGVEQFMGYGGDGANVPKNVFKSYGKGTNTPVEIFTNYGNSSGPSTTKFVEYGKDAIGVASTKFSTYLGNETSSSFKDYFNSVTSFNGYNNTSSTSSVEPGKFFRRRDITEGKVIVMPDIRDKMPKRSFLPRALAKLLPMRSGVFMSKMPEAKTVIDRTIWECERAGAKGETKRCVSTIEEMSEFASEMIGKRARVRTTESTVGSGMEVEVRKVKGGEEVKVVSCHQSMFPYLVYYCHAVPRVEGYEVEVKVVGMKEEMVNVGVVVCHVDTSEWSEGHEAFMALGFGPGKIEVCHWIYENDLAWFPW
ncbi:polygalacturonase 1 beta-like protein 2 [Dioscorea cayenensis subsp. rotundata]|uniref:Polygalacturonase 1 beta-like protein 2 n=1 Tax=Dioscorea cayennensis subsp. rotundata TaxID=55577 RepID=A0AB40B5T7_DIOCR|nr:polygalacturonase 1 beta-like protein 2 [Dioscorea cayenensis subsp. rotundata]